MVTLGKLGDRNKEGEEEMKTLRILACALFLGGVCCMTSCGKKEETAGSKLNAAVSSAKDAGSKAANAAKATAEDAKKKADKAAQ